MKVDILECRTRIRYTLYRVSPWYGKNWHDNKPYYRRLSTRRRFYCWC